MLRWILALSIALAALSPVSALAADGGFKPLACESSTDTDNVLDLAGAHGQFLTFTEAGYANGDQFYYQITSNGKYAEGYGTFNTGSPNTFTRDANENSSDGVDTPLTLTGETVILCAGMTSGTLQDGIAFLDVEGITADSVDIENADTTITRDSAGRVDIEGIPVNIHTDSATEPTSPKAGDGWYDYDSGAFVKELCDADSCQWVEVGVGASTMPLPAGTLTWQTAVSGATTCPDGTLLANGARDLSKTTYQRLWSRVAVATNLVTGDDDDNTDGQWEDNEDGTFDLINLTASNRFIRAADGSTLTVGTVQADGAPDIDGSLTNINVGKNTTTIGQSGALTAVDNSTGIFSDGSAGERMLSFAFAASADDPTYSDSVSEIRPTNIALLPCIVY